jgi:protein-tyrosine kinase
MERAPTPLEEAIELSSKRAIEFRGKSTRDSIWTGLREFTLSSQTLDENRIVTVNRSDDAHIAFDLIRTRILQVLRQNGWTSIAITSPRPRCGTSVIAANLAFSLAKQKDCRTILVDLDLKHPRIGQMLGMKDPPSMEAFLQGAIDHNRFLRRYEDNLAIGGNGWVVDNSAELLQSRETARVLENMQQTMDPDVVLYDMPSMLSCDDVAAFLPNVDCAILVAAAEQSTFDELDVCEKELSERTNFLGVVLNKCRYDDAC